MSFRLHSQEIMDEDPSKAFVCEFPYFPPVHSPSGPAAYYKC